jgi:hypothetical protein
MYRLRLRRKTSRCAGYLKPVGGGGGGGALKSINSQRRNCARVPGGNLSPVHP